jgi:transposase
LVDGVKERQVRKALLHRRDIIAFWWEHPLDAVQEHILGYYLQQFDFYSTHLIEIECKISSTLALTDHGSAVSYIKSIPGLGFMTAVTLVAELGSANRFKNGSQAAASCDLTTKLKGSGGVTHAGRITKDGSKVARRAVYAAAKAVIRFSEEHHLFYKRIKTRRGGRELWLL